MRISDWSSDVCSSDLALTRAARQRLALLGIPSSTIAAVERGGRPNNVITVSAPTDGVIKTLGVRAGMTVAAGQTLEDRQRDVEEKSVSDSGDIGGRLIIKKQNA